jgi:hypothetical protein
VDDEDSGGCSSAFREERQRSSLSVEIIHPATIASSSRLQREVRLPDLQYLLTNALEQSRSLIHRRTWRVPSAAFNVTGSHFLARSGSIEEPRGISSLGTVFVSL